jgi:hypothetical protein
MLLRAQELFHQRPLELAFRIFGGYVESLAHTQLKSEMGANATRPLLADFFACAGHRSVYG